MLINFKLLLGNSLNEEQIDEIVEKTMSEYASETGQDGKKYMNQSDFEKILKEA